MVLRGLVARHGSIYTTEPIVHERTGVLLREAKAASDRREAGTRRIVTG
jgi:hypothetical protein